MVAAGESLLLVVCAPGMVNAHVVNTLLCLDFHCKVLVGALFAHMNHKAESALAQHFVVLKVRRLDIIVLSAQHLRQLGVVFVCLEEGKGTPRAKEGTQR